MKRKYYRLSGVCACVLMIGWHSQVFADEFESNDQSIYQNQAQVQHAQNAADEFAASEGFQEYLRERLGEEEAKENPNPDLVEQLESLIAQFDTNPSAVDEKAVNSFAADEVERLRLEEGMGWGEIAHALGVHPSVLGLGHTKTKGLNSTDAELAIATAMDLKTGNGIGHGKAYDDAGGMGKSTHGNGGQKSGKDKSDKGNNGGNGNGGKSDNSNGKGKDK